MEKSVSQNIRLGFLVISGLVIFVVGLYVLGNKQSMFGKMVPISAIFRNVNGLLIGNNVRYSGIDAGVVTSIDMLNDTSIRVGMEIERSISKYIRKDASAGIGSDGLVGNTIINISPGKSLSGLIEAGDQIQTISKISTDEILSTLKVTNDNAALLSADLLKITNEVISGNGMIGLLLKDEQMAKDLSAMINNLKSTSAKANQSAEKIDKILAGLNNKNNVLGVIQDTNVAREIKSIVSNLKASSKQIETVVSNANAAVTNLKEGNGAINYLSNDPKLVNQINQSMVKIDSALYQVNTAGIKLNENLEALKHNIFFRKYFRNLEKQKNKENE